MLLALRGNTNVIMNTDRISKCLKTGKSVNIEFKECNIALPQSVCDTVCSFSNRLGGYLFLGVKDSGEVIGIEPESVQSIKREFTENLKNPQKITPPLHIQLKAFGYSFGLQRSRAAEVLTELMDENLLKREGSGRGTKYVPAKG